MFALGDPEMSANDDKIYQSCIICHLQDKAKFHCPVEEKCSYIILSVSNNQKRFLKHIYFKTVLNGSVLKIMKLHHSKSISLKQ